MCCSWHPPHSPKRAQKGVVRDGEGERICLMFPQPTPLRAGATSITTSSPGALYGTSITRPSKWPRPYPPDTSFSIVIVFSSIPHHKSVVPGVLQADSIIFHPPPRNQRLRVRHPATSRAQIIPRHSGVAAELLALRPLDDILFLADPVSGIPDVDRISVFLCETISHIDYM